LMIKLSLKIQIVKSSRLMRIENVRGIIKRQPIAAEARAENRAIIPRGREADDQQKRRDNQNRDGGFEDSALRNVAILTQQFPPPINR